MKTTKFLTYTIFVLFLGFAIASCSGDDGATGPAGADGTDGIDGQDGSANVQTFTFDISDKSGVWFSLAVPQITQEVLDNNVILHYLISGISYIPVPGRGFNPACEVVVRNALGEALFVFYQMGTTDYYTIDTGEYDEAKIIIFESSGKSSSGKQAIYTELKNAGVDINDYYDVCDYYGINTD